MFITLLLLLRTLAEIRSPGFKSVQTKTGQHHIHTTPLLVPFRGRHERHALSKSYQRLQVWKMLSIPSTNLSINLLLISLSFTFRRPAANSYNFSKSHFLYTSIDSGSPDLKPLHKSPISKQSSRLGKKNYDPFPQTSYDS